MSTIMRTWTARRGLIAVGNEIGKGLRHGWSERLQIFIALPLFIVFLLLIGFSSGKADTIAASGRLDWRLEPGHMAWLLLGFVAFTYTYRMAVVESRRGTGIGRELVEAAVQHCRRHAAARLLVATAAADIGNLRFYQRLGFRMLRIERDAFGTATGYSDGTIIDGIPLRDRVWLDQELS